MEIEIGADGARPEGEPPPKVTLIANGEKVADFLATSGILAYQFDYLPTSPPFPGDLLLEIKSETFAPPGDAYRHLGILVNTVTVRPLFAPLSPRPLLVCLAAALTGTLFISLGYLLLRHLGVSQLESSGLCLLVFIALVLALVRQWIAMRSVLICLGPLIFSYVVVVFVVDHREPLLSRAKLLKVTLRGWLQSVALVLRNPATMKVEKVEVILGRIFMSLISIVLTFLILDFVSLWFISSRAPIERKFPVEAVRRPKPYTMFGGEANTGDLNSLGYRGKVPLIPKATDEFRVFMLGGSTVFMGNPPIAVLLEEEFKRNGFQNVKVYNFGVVSSVSGIELSQIVFEISELEPDLVVMYNGGNDILHPWSWDPRPGYPFNFIAYESNPLLESDVRSYPSVALFAYGSNIFRYLFPSYFIKKFVPLEQLREETRWKSEEWKAEIARIYVENLVKADKISSSFGAEFIAFFQPLIYFKSPLSVEEEQLIDSDEKNYAIDIQKRILSEIEEVKTSSSVKIIDLSTIYEGTSQQVFTDSIHTRQQSRIVVAQEMYRQIVNSFELKGQ
ncbi:MAG: hypothetical protein ACETWR_03050 [Anaerolineae bacterium]